MNMIWLYSNFYIFLVRIILSYFLEFDLEIAFYSWNQDLSTITSYPDDMILGRYGLIYIISYLLFYQRTTRRNRKGFSSPPLQVGSSHWIKQTEATICQIFNFNKLPKSADDICNLILIINYFINLYRLIKYLILTWPTDCIIVRPSKFILLKSYQFVNDLIFIGCNSSDKGTYFNSTCSLSLTYSWQYSQGIQWPKCLCG